jgi:hypothetical protein
VNWDSHGATTSGSHERELAGLVYILTRVEGATVSSWPLAEMLISVCQLLSDVLEQIR